MTSVLDHDLGTILDNYADVIEGGNSWRGSGTVYNGIPGRYPDVNFLRDGSESTLTVSGAVSTTKFDVSALSWDSQDHWVSSNGTPFFVVDANDEIRKIVGYAPSTGRFTVAPAFTTAPAETDTLSVYQGFKRQANLADIEADDESGEPEHHYRTFHLFAMPGEELRWWGDSYKLMRTELELRLRMGKYNRLHDWTAAIFTNLSIIRSVITRQEFIPSYVKAMFSSEGQSAEIVTDDVHKIVAVDRYTLIYAIDATYK